MTFTRASVCLLLLALAACGGKPEKPPYAGIKVGKPYEVYGRWYEPSYSAHYDEIGKASWYGPGFHGGHTASGERFDENALTAAHKTLPLPSIVRVTNLDNGVSALIKINDRGPFSHDRIIDLSKGAAIKLGVYRTGTAKVRVQFLDKETREYVQNAQNGIGYAMNALSGLDPEAAGAREERGAQPQLLVEAHMFPPNAPPAPMQPAARPAPAPVVPGGDTDEFAVVSAADTAPAEARSLPAPALQPAPFSAPASAKFFVQAGTFSQEDNAYNLSDRLEGQGTPQIMEIMQNGRKLYRVMVGPFDQRKDAKNMLSKLASIGMPDAKIIRN